MIREYQLTHDLMTAVTHLLSRLFEEAQTILVFEGTQTKFQRKGQEFHRHGSLHQQNHQLKVQLRLGLL